MSDSLMGVIVFYGLAALTIGGAVWVAFSRNIVHSAFALLGTLIGAAGLYAFLAAELMVVLQVMVYVGGILVLILFAVMLTSRIADAKVSNPSVGLVPGLVLLVLIAASVSFVAVGVFGDVPKTAAGPTVADIGTSLLETYLLPFQVASIVLLAVLVGAVGIARGVRREDLKEPLPIESSEPLVDSETEQTEKVTGEAA